MGAEPCCRQVMVRLRSSCANLSKEDEEEEEEGANLFNCQASAEGHQTYPCTPDTEELGKRLKLETCDCHNLQQLVLAETLTAVEQHRVAQLMEDIAQQMGNDLTLLLAQQQRMEEVMEKLQQVNQSLGLVLTAVEGARSQLENHLQHLHTVLDPPGQSPSAISTSILHGSYLVLLAALLMLTPPHAILLLFLFFLTSSTLSIPALSVLLVFTVAGQWLVAAARRGAGGAWLVLPQEKPHHQLTSTPDRECKIELLQEELDGMEMSCLQEPSRLEQPPAMAGDTPCVAGRVSPVPSGWRTKLSSCGGPRDISCRTGGSPGPEGTLPNRFFPSQAMLESATGAGKRWEPKPCSPSQSLANDVSLLSPRSPCQGLTRAGQRCRKKAIPGQEFCHIHATGQASGSHLATDLSPHV
ncbi:protein brambleberry-like [Tyto alba]|uniref:protein brambleberry-like n=1 Tax=Tyto alba TaxID=56313 RepID=UPI001C679802|nr:protein brambleberry-like [Tyto alba]